MIPGESEFSNEFFKQKFIDLIFIRHLMKIRYKNKFLNYIFHLNSEL